MVATLEDNNNLTQLRVDVGEIKGILVTVVAAHAERLGKVEADDRQMRIDLTAVKNNADMAHSALALLVEANKNKIAEVAVDTQEVKDKQNGATQRTVLILSPFIAIGSLVWNILGGSK